MKICEAGRSSGCCSNPNIRTINTMSADTVGNFTIRGDMGIHVTVGTNEIIISGIMTYYDNTDGNIVIDTDLLTINLADDLAITGDVSIGGDLGVTGDVSVTGDAVIAGDLTVNGTYYTVHAEHVYTQDDYIILREGATTPLAAGSYAGFQVTKYDGTNDGRLVVDNAGVARVGDVGDEQPLLTRDEAADLTDGDLLIWDAADSKAVGIAQKGQIIRTTIDGGQTYSGTDLQLAVTLVTGDSDYFEITDAGTTITIKEAGNYILSYEIDLENISNNDAAIFGYIGTTLISLARSQLDSTVYKNVRSTTIFSTTANTKIKILLRSVSGVKTTSLGHIELARL